MTKKPRPVRPSALRAYAAARIRPQLGPETLVRRYTVFVPVEQIMAGEVSRQIATRRDLRRLQEMLIRHFGGVTASVITPSLIGSGARDPRRPKSSQ